MPDRFICEPITPVAGTMDISAMAIGEPGLPKRFLWRNEEYTVDRVLEKWKELGAEPGGDNKYVRKHWYRILTTSGHEMKLYFERQSRSRAQQKVRWWLFTMMRTREEGGP